MLKSSRTTRLSTRICGDDSVDITITVSATATDGKLISAHGDPTLKTGEPQNVQATPTTMRKGESTSAMDDNLRLQLKAVDAEAFDADVNNDEEIPASPVVRSSVLPELWCQHAGYELWKYYQSVHGIPL